MNDKQVNPPLPTGKKQTEGADLMEGASRARKNRRYDTAVRNLRASFNPNHVREIDKAAYQFCPHHVFKAVKDADGKNTGEIIIAYYAGEHMSNTDLDYADKLMEDKDTQERGAKALEESGYITEALEPESDAEVLA